MRESWQLVSEREWQESRWLEEVGGPDLLGSLLALQLSEATAGRCGGLPDGAETWGKERGEVIVMTVKNCKVLCV